MKNYKKFSLFVILLLVGLLLFQIIQTYAKYLTTASGSTNIAVAEWNVKVNQISITDQTSDISATIVPVFPGTSHIAANIIAPTAEGYFDLNFDFSDVDVSLSYTINMEVNEDSPVQDLVATGYAINDGTRVNFQTFNTPITETILLGSNITTRKVRIYLLWNDDSLTQTMDNAADALSTTSATPVSFDVNLSFIQVRDSNNNSNTINNNTINDNNTTNNNNITNNN